MVSCVQDGTSWKVVNAKGEKRTCGGTAWLTQNPLEAVVRIF